MKRFSGLLGASVQLVFADGKSSTAEGTVHEISQRPWGQDIQTFLKVQLPDGRLRECVCPPDYIVAVDEKPHA